MPLVHCKCIQKHKIPVNTCNYLYSNGIFRRFVDKNSNLYYINSIINVEWGRFLFGKYQNGRHNRKIKIKWKPKLIWKLTAVAKCPDFSGIFSHVPENAQILEWAQKTLKFYQKPSVSQKSSPRPWKVIYSRRSHGKIRGKSEMNRQVGNLKVN